MQKRCKQEKRRRSPEVVSAGNSALCHPPGPSPKLCPSSDVAASCFQDLLAAQTPACHPGPFKGISSYWPMAEVVLWGLRVWTTTPTTSSLRLRGRCGWPDSRLGCSKWDISAPLPVSAHKQVHRAQFCLVHGQLNVRPDPVMTSRNCSFFTVAKN